MARKDRTVDDYRMIEELSAAYNMFFDAGDYARWLECFTEDGEFERSNAPGTVKGHEALEEMGRGFGVRGRHVTTGSVIEIDGDSARHRCYLLYLDRDQGHSVVMFGVYDDQLEKRNGQWKFRRRYLQVDE